MTRRDVPRIRKWFRNGALGIASWLALPSQAEPPVSYFREIAPIFVQSCRGCHHPGKLKGGLDLSSFDGLNKGGKHGPVLTPGEIKESPLLNSIQGPDATMPKNGDPLSARECALLERWIREGALDDSPPVTHAPPQPPIYTAPPVITALAYSPDGGKLAVAGSREVLLLNATNHQIEARWVGASSRVESFEFSPDGRHLAVAAGTPGIRGEIRIWELASGLETHAYPVAFDSVYGVHWSPDGTRVAFGCADKTARILRVSDGRELVKFEQHSDWVFGAVFVKNGTQIVSGSRDKSLKLVDAQNGALLDILNRDSEPIQCLARHPQEDWVIFGSEVRPRLYRATAKADNMDPNADPNAIREFQHFDQGVTAVVFSPDGKWLAATGGPAGEVRVHEVANAQRKATLRGHDGLVFGLSFNPDGTQLATAGYEGKVRIFDWAKERLVAAFIPVPISTNGPVTASAK